MPNAHILTRDHWYIDPSVVFVPAPPGVGTWEHIQTTYPPDDPAAPTEGALKYLLATPGGGAPNKAYLIAVVP